MYSQKHKQRLVLDIASRFASQNVIIIAEPCLNFVQKLEFSRLLGNLGLCNYHGILSSEVLVYHCRLHEHIGMILVAVHDNDAQ